LRRLLYTALSESRLSALNEQLRARGLEPLDPTQPLVPRGVPDRAIGVSVDCADVFDRKVEALRCHRTQGEMEDIPYDLWPEVLGREEFQIAWPEAERPAAPVVLRDVFEGLPAT
jgi:LmbE family N-acetylglucosaminyl deacetylase